MRCRVVTCLLDDNGEQRIRYGLLRLFDWKILGWEDLHLLIPEDKQEGLPEPIVKELGADGTALFDSRQNILQVKAVLEGI